MPVPIIDIFAGPGGLGEGFSSLKDHKRQPFFKIGLSIEKDPVAHRTLMLRAVFRRLSGSKDVKHYYRYVRGEIDEITFRKISSVAAAFEHASKEARCLELGKSDATSIDGEIRTVLKGQKTWVLIGGPPCQAYSLAGRSRRANDKNFHKDEKHFLYKEYLRIIQVHKPTIFVMENVKGLLSSKHSGNSMFENIIEDLSSPAEGLEYEIRSFTKKGNSDSLIPTDYIIHSENYGIPQNRHRVILLGVRKGSGVPQHHLLTPLSKSISIKQAIDDLPKIRSKLSKGDSPDAWREAIQTSSAQVRGWRTGKEPEIIDTMRAFASAATNITTGSAFIPCSFKRPKKQNELQQWLYDQNLGGVCQHEARGHMASDLARYLFSASYAHRYECSPSLDEFPSMLLPAHVNVNVREESETIPFKDRFRVQCKNVQATTVVSHIAKIGRASCRERV